jgi:hypothetical protein
MRCIDQGRRREVAHDRSSSAHAPIRRASLSHQLLSAAHRPCTRTSAHDVARRHGTGRRMRGQANVLARDSRRHRRLSRHRHHGVRAVASTVHLVHRRRRSALVDRQVLHHLSPVMLKARHRRQRAPCHPE